MLVSLMANWVKVCQVAGAIAIHRQGESDYRNEAGHMTSAWSTQFSRADTGLLQLDMVDLLKLAEQNGDCDNRATHSHLLLWFAL